MRVVLDMLIEKLILTTNVSHDMQELLNGLTAMHYSVVGAWRHFVFNIYIYIYINARHNRYFTLLFSEKPQHYHTTLSFYCSAWIRNTWRCLSLLHMRD